MAKVTITVEDMPNGRVSIKAEPNFETMMKLDISGHTLQPAHGLAIAMLNEARRISKSNDPTNLIKIPRLGR